MNPLAVLAVVATVFAAAPSVDDIWGAVPLVQGNQISCSGWMMASNLLVTNSHCARVVGQMKIASFPGFRMTGAVVRYTEWRPQCAAELSTGDQAADCHLRADVAFLQTSRQAVLVLDVSLTDALVGEAVTIPNHQLLRERDIVDGVVIGYGDLHTGEDMMVIRSSAGSGASGSPVLNADGRVVGMLSRRSVDGTHNFAVPVSVIVAELKRAARSQ